MLLHGVCMTGKLCSISASAPDPVFSSATGSADRNGSNNERTWFDGAGLRGSAASLRDIGSGITPLAFSAELASGTGGGSAACDHAAGGRAAGAADASQ